MKEPCRKEGSSFAQLIKFTSSPKIDTYFLLGMPPFHKWKAEKKWFREWDKNKNKNMRE